MRESKSGHHRYSTHEESLCLINNDGVDLFISGPRFHQSICSAHMEFLVKTGEPVYDSFAEKWREPQTPKDIYQNIMFF
ncbi:hypothetical protein [Bacillus massilinigeriensis]|uniref:hypothetical protein n=1 Tax=Bacillus mediterraneensis TaxID=1805474 RepID=UPI0008F891A0|nr:hypothetical protein [Bacillus mediterraneensis]